MKKRISVMLTLMMLLQLMPFASLTANAATLRPSATIINAAGNVLVMTFTNPSSSDITDVNVELYKGDTLIGRKTGLSTGSGSKSRISFGLTDDYKLDNVRGSAYEVKINLTAGGVTHTTEYDVLNGSLSGKNFYISSYGLGLSPFQDYSGKNFQIVEIKPDFNTFKGGTSSFHLNMYGYIKNDGSYSSSSPGYSALHTMLPDVTGLNSSKYYEFVYYYKGSKAPYLYYGSSSENDKKQGMLPIIDSNGNESKAISTTEGDWTKVTGIFQGTTFRSRVFNESSSREYWIDELSLKEADYNPDTKTYTVAEDAVNLFKDGGFDRAVANLAIKNNSKLTWDIVGNATYHAINIYKGETLIGTVSGTAKEYEIPSQHLEDNAVYTVSVADSSGYVLPGVSVQYTYKKIEDESLVASDVVVTGGGESIAYAFNNPADSGITSVKVGLYKGGNLVSENNSSVTSAGGLVTGSFGITDGVVIDHTFGAEYTVAVTIDAGERSYTKNYTVINGARNSGNSLRFSTYGLPLSAYNGSGANQIIKVEPDFNTYKAGNSSLFFNMRGYMKKDGTYTTSSPGFSAVEIEANAPGLDSSKYYEFSYYYKGNEPEMYYGSNNNTWNGWPGMLPILDASGNQVKKVKTTDGEWTKVTAMYKGSTFYLRIFNESGNKKFWLDELSLKEANYNPDTMTYTVVENAPNLYANGGFDRAVSNLEFRDNTRLTWDIIGNSSFMKYNIYKGDTFIGEAEGTATDYIIPSQYLEENAVYTVKTVSGAGVEVQGVSVVAEMRPGEIDETLVPKDVVVTGLGDRIVYAFNNPNCSTITRVKTAVYKGDTLLGQKSSTVTSASGFISGSYGVTDEINLDNTIDSEYTFEITIDAGNKTNTVKYKFLNGKKTENNWTTSTYGIGSNAYNATGALQIAKFEPDYNVYKAGSSSMHFRMRGYIRNDGTYASGSAGHSSLQLEYHTISALDPGKYYEFSYYYKGNEPEMYYGSNNDVWNNWPGMQPILNASGVQTKKVKTTEGEWTKVTGIYQGSSFKLRFFHEGESKEFWVDEISLKEADYNPETMTYTVVPRAQNLYTNGGFDKEVINPTFVDGNIIVWTKPETALFSGIKIYKDDVLLGGIGGSNMCYVVPENKFDENSTYKVTTYDSHGIESQGVIVSKDSAPIFVTKENNVSNYLKFEADVAYEYGNDTTVNLRQGTLAEALVRISNNGIVIGGSKLVSNIENGTYHIDAVLNYKKKLALVTITLPNGKVAQSSNVEYFAGMDTVEGILFVSMNNENKTEDVFKNIVLNVADESDLPEGIGMSNIKIYDGGNVVSDTKKVPVSANKITVDVYTPVLDKALLDSAVSVDGANIASTTYADGIYTINLSGSLNAGTVYEITFDESLTGTEKTFEFKTKQAEYAEITGITKSGAAVDELSDINAGDTVRVNLSKNISSGYSVMAAGYTADGNIKFTKLSGTSTDVKIDTLTDIDEVRFFVWDMDEGMKALSDVYILPADTFESGDVYNLVTTFVGDAGEERGFAWTANTGFTDMVIQYAEKGKFWNDENVSEASYTEYNGLLYYKAEIDNLTPGKTYVYRIGDAEDNVWSKTYSFTTEAEGTDEFTFIGITDPQSGAWNGGYEYMKYTLDAAMADAPETAFMVNLGDLTDDGREESHWTNHFKALSGYGESLPYMAVMGNHETRGDAVTAGKNFSLHFNNPDNGANALGDLTADDVVQDYSKGVVNNIAESVYSFEYGNAYFAVLNTGSDWSSTDTYIMLEKQKEWLREDMKASDKKWKIVMLHQGLYPAKAERWDTRGVLEDVLNECGVDLVLGGHDHIVSRTYAMKNGEIADATAFDRVEKGSGFVYTILGSAGPKRYEKVGTLPAYSAVLNATQSNLPTYTLFDVSDSSINVITKQIDGAVVDSFTIAE